jgi:GR25 family glycosyltransferase involved in LPS biosynthesis
MWHQRFKRRYVINLPTRPDRRSRVLSELARLDMPAEIFDAILGKDNVFAAWFFRTILKQTAPITAGLMGCQLSHAMIWAQTILDARIAADDFVLIMEDDLIWHPETTNPAIESLLSRVPADANMIKFSVCDYTSDLHDLEERKQIEPVADKIYRQIEILGGTLMYAVRKRVLPALLSTDYHVNFDNAIVPQTYLLLPHSVGIANQHTENFHFGVCYQGDDLSNVNS